ncbi:FAD-binding oxidoreductase [Streptomyces sp. NPDC050560]|uniref:FAD-binding oxidoreductase n=1 Tax=Streptomyces sp. NPDC050560 TaxID=3365630 RepID=UPI00379BB5EC
MNTPATPAPSDTTATAAVPRLRPASLAELRDVVRDTARTAPRLLVAGAGTAAGWGGAPEPPDAVLDTTALGGVQAHNPADMTVAVRAGTLLSELREELSEHGQRVAFDPARADATVGGLLATADGGPLQQAYGTLRDLVIGVTVVLADGTVAGSGGHVIKNVAGYDLAKLFHGSLGTLGVVAEVVLRLHPLPACVRTVAVAATPSEASELGGRLMAKGLEPAALDWVDGLLLVRLEGTADGTRTRADAVRGLAPRGADARLLDGDTAAGHGARTDLIARGGHGDTVLRFGALPTAAARIAEALPKAADGVTVETAGAVGVGVHTVRLSGGGAEGHAALAHRLREAVERADGTCTVLRRDGLPGSFPAWGRPPAAVGVLRAVKNSFDPGGRFGAGRLAGWLPAPPAAAGTGGTEADADTAAGKGATRAEES